MTNSPAPTAWACAISAPCQATFRLSGSRPFAILGALDSDRIVPVLALRLTKGKRIQTAPLCSPFDLTAIEEKLLYGLLEGENNRSLAVNWKCMNVRSGAIWAVCSKKPAKPTGNGSSISIPTGDGNFFQKIVEKSKMPVLRQFSFPQNRAIVSQLLFISL
jgi:hypothetical protein